MQKNHEGTVLNQVSLSSNTIETEMTRVPERQDGKKTLKGP